MRTRRSPRALAPLGLVLVATVAVGASPAPVAVLRDTLAVEAALRGTPGRPRVVHLWATWCRPCLAEWPGLAEWLRGIRRRPIDVVIVSLDEADADHVALCERTLNDAGPVPGRSYVAPPEVAGPAILALDPSWDGALPTTLVFDGGGDLRLTQRGLTRLDVLQAEIDRLSSKRVKPNSRKEPVP